MSAVEAGGVEPVLRRLVQVSHEHDVLAARPVADEPAERVATPPRRLARIAYSSSARLSKPATVGSAATSYRAVLTASAPPAPVEDGPALGGQLDHALRLLLAARAQLRPLAHVDADHLDHDEPRQQQQQAEDDVESGEDGVASGDGSGGLRVMGDE